MAKNKAETIQKAQADLKRFLELYVLTLDDIVTPSDSKPATRYLTLAGAAKYCSVSKFTLARAVKAQALSQIKLTRSKQGSVRFDIEDLERWMKGLKKLSGCGRNLSSK